MSAFTQIVLCGWGEGKHAVCLSRDEGYLPPRSRRSRASTTTTCRRRRLSPSSTTVCVEFGECGNDDFDESGKALAKGTITIRPHRLAVMPEVYASGSRDTAAAARRVHLL